MFARPRRIHIIFIFLILFGFLTEIIQHFFLSNKFYLIISFIRLSKNENKKSLNLMGHRNEDNHFCTMTRNVALSRCNWQWPMQLPCIVLILLQKRGQRQLFVSIGVKALRWFISLSSSKCWDFNLSLFYFNFYNC